MSKSLTYSSFIIASLVVIVAFMTSTTYFQLGVAIILYPMLAYFAFKTFPRKTRVYPLKKPVTGVQPPVEPASPDASQGGSTEKVEAEIAKAKIERTKIEDIDKRAFLKLIGGTGITLFLFSFLSKKTESLFPGIAHPAPGLTLLKDTIGNKIDPAQSHPTDGYRISEIDDNVISFYGFTNKDGAWFIMRGDTDRKSVV